jgi:hypothetical protein
LRRLVLKGGTILEEKKKERKKEKMQICAIDTLDTLAFNQTLQLPGIELEIGGTILEERKNSIYRPHILSTDHCRVNADQTIKIPAGLICDKFQTRHSLVA